MPLSFVNIKFAVASSSRWVDRVIPKKPAAIESNDKSIVNSHSISPEKTREFFCFATIMPQRNNYRKMDVAMWEETKWRI